MEHPKIRVSVELNLFPADAKRLEKFLEDTGRKRGPYIRQLVLKELDFYEAIKSGKTQVSLDYCQMKIVEIAEICSTNPRTIRRWIHQISDKMPVLLDKMSEAFTKKQPADYNLLEVIAIIRAGGRNTLADLLLQNAKEQENRNNEVSCCELGISASALANIVSEAVTKALEIQRRSIPEPPKTPRQALLQQKLQNRPNNQRII